MALLLYCSSISISLVFLFLNWIISHSSSRFLNNIQFYIRMFLKIKKNGKYIIHNVIFCIKYLCIWENHVFVMPVFNSFCLILPPPFSLKIACKFGHNCVLYIFCSHSQWDLSLFSNDQHNKPSQMGGENKYILRLQQSYGILVLIIVQVPALINKNKAASRFNCSFIIFCILKPKVLCFVTQPLYG